MTDLAPNHRGRALLPLAVVFAVVALAGVAVVSRYALLSVSLELLAALVVVVPALMFGVVLCGVFRLGRMPQRWHFLLSAALGLGAMSLLVLFAGLAGLLARPLWVGLIGALFVLGLDRMRRDLRSQKVESQTLSADTQWAAGGTRYLWLIAAPFLSLALLAATNAPGFIWQEEGFGYDVLEYHLQLPKEYRQAGRIAYQPHNVYANFPANVEMLYLLGMVLQDDDVETGVSANLIHLIFGALTVVAAWVAGREWSPRAGALAGLAAASVGWLGYLSGLAYVENGMLFFGMAAAAALLRAARLSEDYRRRWLILAGVLAGFACGCKYTAVPMIALPLGVGVLFMPARSWRARIVDGVAYAAAAAVTMSPWLVKNQLMTGSPVFPLANGVFEASPPGWGEPQAAMWKRGHQPAPEERSITGRLAALWRHVPGDHYQRFGPAILTLAIGGLFCRKRDRVDLILVMILTLQLAVWLLATHLYARFAVVLLIPLALLAGRAAGAAVGRLRMGIIVGVLVVGSAWNFVFAADLHRRESPGGAPAALFYEGKVPGYEHLGFVNGLSEDTRILLVGDARAFYYRRSVDYCVVFNRSPFVEAVRSAADEAGVVAWLREQGYTHVVVDWSEIARLTATYGFAPEVNDDLFRRLEAEGLKPVSEFAHPDTGRRLVSVFETPVE